MSGSWRICLATAAAFLIGTASAKAEISFAILELEQLKQPDKEPKKDPKKDAKKEPKKEPKKEAKKEPKKEVKDITIAIQRRGPIGHAYGYWPGPVLPGMWGGTWGGLWPNSWWMGGPYLYSGWSGPWAGGQASGGCCCRSGAHPTLLPPVFKPSVYPAVSPYWVPRQAFYWYMPAAAKPAVLGSADPKKPAREYRAVASSASVEGLYADALWLFFDDNFTSARDHLAAAIKQSPRDARLWYYKALAERATGDDVAARQSAEKGAALEITGVTDRRTVVTALERIQGTDRAFLSDLVSGPKALSVSTANEIVAALKSTTLTSAK